MPTPEELAAQQAAEAADKKFAGLDPETQKFVKDLREEAKGYRLKLSTIETELSDFKKRQADAEAEELKKKNEHEKLATMYKQELDSVKPELERLKAIETARHKALLEKLPDDAREKYSSVSTDILEDLVARLEKKEPLPPKTPGSGNGQVNPWSTKTFNLTEQSRIKREDPAKAESLKQAAVT